MVKKQIIKNILLFAFWCVVAGGTVMLLVAAIQKKDARKCTGVEVNIKGVNNNFFVDKNDILETITAICDGRPVGKTVGSFNLGAIEKALQENIWVKGAQLFFDNNEKLQVNVLEREPVARVFTTNGATFYIDSSLAMLPLSEKFSARLPVFTNFPSDDRVLLNADSNLLKDILTVSMAIQQDTFNMAMIDQVDITPQRNFEMMPKFGNTIIAFGDGKNALEKFSKLRLFYKQVMAKAGWNKYSEINVQYSNQVVAKRKGVEEVKADSIRTLQLMKVIADNAERLSNDSLQAITTDNEHNTTNSSIIQQSVERDDNNPTANTSEVTKPQGAGNEKPSPVKSVQQQAEVKPAIITISKPAIAHTLVVSKPAGANSKPPVKQTGKPKAATPSKPKVLMPAKAVNEY
ncbi:MAG: hypothetical protein H7211_16880 [Aquabacterium sp.]|nr:hypothetical protein [Ferruginibacter sp.]